LIHPVRVPGSQQPGHHAIYGIAGMVFSVTACSASAIVVKRMAADVPQSRVSPGTAATQNGNRVSLPG